MCRCIDRTTPGNAFLWRKLAAAMHKYPGLPCSFYPALWDARGTLPASRHRQGRRRGLFRSRGYMSRWARALLVWCSHTERGDTKANVERKHWSTRERLARCWSRQSTRSSGTIREQRQLARCWSRQSTRSSGTIREQRHTFSSYKRLKGQEHEKM